MPRPSLDFGRRKRRLRDDGSDFEDFVFECFRAAKEESGFEKRLARGRDGAIDLQDRSIAVGGIKVAECKFIGSSEAKEAFTRWSEVYKNLKNNLPDLVANPEKRRNSPYRAWLDPQRRVTDYRFCVTAVMSDLERSRLEVTIASNFKELVESGVETLRILCETPGAIKVLRWDWFHNLLELNPALSFRWFGGLPKGVKVHVPHSESDGTFKGFLTAGKLQYFSRDEFLAQGNGVANRGEAQLTADLIGEASPCLIIAGPGGVGKTRLAWELSNVLSDAKHGFDAYQLNRSASFESLRTLISSYSQPASILFIVDYAEAQLNLSELAEEADYQAENSGHRIRMIVTCRSSATTQVRDNLAALNPKAVSLASPMDGEDAYVRWVTRSILNLEKFLDQHALERVCRGVPVLAAFAVFLFRNYRPAFDEQFGALLGIEDFDNWVQHRISFLVRSGGDPYVQERELAKIGLMLPCSRDQLEGLGGVNISVLQMLTADRWIELVGDEYFAAHDVFADALVARWIFSAEHVATERLIDLLEQSARIASLPKALTALDRLANHAKFGALSGAAVAKALFDKHLDLARDWYPRLLDGNLLTFDEKVELLEHDDVVSPIVEASPILDVQLCRLAAEAHWLHSSPDQRRILTNLLSIACDRPQYSNMVLRRAYALDPAQFRERALQSIANFPFAENTHFILVQMLRSGECPENIRDDIINWLSKNLCFRASFLYRAWLEEDGDIEAVSGAVPVWVREYGALPEAQFVYTAWLNAKGDIGVLSAAILAWVSEHRALPEARFLFAAWLNAKGDMGVVSEAILAWIDEHGALPEAQFVYTAWLNARGDIGAVFDAVLAWIDKYGALPEARFLFIAWLNAGSEISAVSDAVLAWIDKYGALPEASHAFEAWLEAKGEVGAVSEAVLAWVGEHGMLPIASHVFQAWLEADGELGAVSYAVLIWIGENGMLPEARHVFKAWLGAQGEIEAVSDAILRWVGEHGDLQGADFLYRSWLEAGGEFRSIERSLTLWAKNWCEYHDFVYLSKALTKQPNLPDEIVLAIVRWCAAFPLDSDTLFRIRRLISSQRKTISPHVVSRISDLVKFVFEERTDLTVMDRLNFWGICSALGHPAVFNIDPFGTMRSIAAIVRSSRVFTPDLRPSEFGEIGESYGQVAQMVLWGLRHKELRLKQDSDGLQQFAAWLKETAEEKNEAILLLRLINAEFPSQIWS